MEKREITRDQFYDDVLSIVRRLRVVYHIPDDFCSIVDEVWDSRPFRGNINVIASLRERIIRGLIDKAAFSIKAANYVRAAEILDLLREQVKKLDGDFGAKI